MAGPLAARTLTVGAGQDYAQPSDAARAVMAGDRVLIQPGTYYDCAVWAADGLVIETAAPGVVLTDTACQGKASFVITGRGALVRGMTFARIRVPDGNGAGIRAEGTDLLVEQVRFEDNQEAILAASQPGSTLQIANCVFANNGVGGGERVAAALMVGTLDRLEIRDSIFTGARAGAIVSDAAETDIAGSQIGGAPTAGATVQVSGGLMMTDTTITAGAAKDGRRVAVLALPAGAGAKLELRRDRLEGGGTLLLNWSGRSAVLDGNAAGADGLIETQAGAWPYRARRAMRAAYTAATGTARHWARGAIDWAKGR